MQMLCGSIKCIEWLGSVSVHKAIVRSTWLNERHSLIELTVFCAIAREWRQPTHQHVGSRCDWLEPVTKGSWWTVASKTEKKVMRIRVLTLTVHQFMLFYSWRSTVWKWGLSAMFWTLCLHHCEFRSLMTYTVRAQCAVQSDWCRTGSYHHHHNHSPCWM